MEDSILKDRLKKLKEERDEGLRKLFIKMALVWIILVAIFSASIYYSYNRISEKGLKNIINEIWEGASDK